MIGWLASYWPTITTWLVVLKYLGLVLAAGASIWGTVSVLTTSDEAGRKRLTFAGRIAIGLTLTGLIISIVSEDLQRRRAADAARVQIAAEAKRTNAIIIAGQPLTSLRVDWKLWGLDPGLTKLLSDGNANALKYIEDQQGERDDQQNGAVFREDQLYPFLAALARRFAKEPIKNGGGNVVVLMTLDDDPNAVLPFGWLADAAPWGDFTSGTSTTANPPSVEIGNNQDMGNTALQSWPSLDVTGTQALVHWRVDPTTFAKSLNRQNSLVVPTAKLPNTLRIAVLFDVTALPFRQRNFALPIDDNFWKFPDYPDTQNDNPRGRLALVTPQFGSSIRLVPNNSDEIADEYRLKQVYETLFLDSYGEANSGLRAVVFEYALQP